VLNDIKKKGLAMKRFLLFLSIYFLLTIGLSGETILVDYKVDFGIISDVGVAHAKLTKDRDKYEIDIKLRATGVAKLLSGDRREEHISRGYIKDGILISNFYHIKKTHGSKKSDTIYRINHKEKRVVKIDKKWKDGKLYKERERILPYYSKDDLLTLYFNLNSYVKDKNSSQDYKFRAVGAEKQMGFVDLHIPNSNELGEYKDLLGEDGDCWYAKAIVHQKIFSSDKGELLLAIGKDGIAKKAVLKDLFLFGDAKAYRIKN